MDVRVRLQLIRHFKTCTTEIYLHNECAHVGLSIDAPVVLMMGVHGVCVNVNVNGRDAALVHTAKPSWASTGAGAAPPQVVRCFGFGAVVCSGVCIDGLMWVEIWLRP